MPSIEKKLRIGIIGSGWIAENRHIPSYMKDGRAEIIGIVDHNISRAERLARSIGVKEHFNDINNLLKLSPDAVSICTPPWTHRDLSIAALERGCHVLTEKPMAMSLQEVDEMIMASRKSGYKLGVVHNFLFSNSMQRAKSLIASGSLGKIITVMALQLSSQRRRLPDWYSRLPGGLFYDEVPHMIYLMQYFCGNFTNVIATSHGVIPQTSHVSKVSAILTNKDVSATLNMIFESPVSDWILTIVSENYVLYIDVFRDIIIAKKAEPSHKPMDVLNSSLSVIIQEIEGVLGSGIKFVTQNLLYGHDILITSFIDSIYENKDPPITAEMGRQIVEVMWQIIERAKLEQTASAEE